MTRSTESHSTITRLGSLFVLLALSVAPASAFAIQKCDPNPNHVPKLECLDGDDSDGDGVCDYEDNCRYTPNPKQINHDGDNLGNACDCDYDGDSSVGGSDFIIFKAAYGSSFPNKSYDPVVDHDCDNDVDRDDLDLFMSAFGSTDG
jgi:hypothetical protein